MKEKLKEMFMLQDKLNRTIFDNMNVLLDKRSVIESNVLAWRTEVAELANETRCFKFWSKKGPSDRHVILEEYADVFHFGLSVGLLCGYSEWIGERLYFDDVENKQSNWLLTQTFNDLFDALTYPNDFGEYLTMMQQILLLGGRLGFTFDEIYNAYMSKNKKNFKRQSEGY